MGVWVKRQGQEGPWQRPGWPCWRAEPERSPGVCGDELASGDPRHIDLNPVLWGCLTDSKQCFPPCPLLGCCPGILRIKKNILV